MPKKTAESKEINPSPSEEQLGELMSQSTKKAGKMAQVVTISAPNMETVALRIRGDAPYVQHRFGQKAFTQMMATQAAGSVAKKGKKREPKDFDLLYREAQHVSTEGWWGMPAAAFRNALVSACRVCGFQMTKAKLSVFVEADGFEDDGQPLIKITKGEPHPFDAVVRNETGVADIRRRPMFDPGWEAVVRIRYDADMFTQVDVANLLLRVGCQVGIGEGRPDSKKSTGMGWGTFQLVSGAEEEAA